MNNVDELESLYQKLEEYKDFDSDPKNCEKFLEIVDQIVLKKDQVSIPILFSYFDDNSEYSWVMEELMLSLENYSTRDFLNQISKDPDFYWNKSDLRIKGLMYGIVNSPNDFQELKQFIQGMKFSNSFIEMLFKVLESSNLPRHAELLAELRKELDQR